MSQDRFDRMEEPREHNTEDMAVRAFSRCQNWPKDRTGIAGLVEGLERAASRFGVPVARIITECVETSPYCPTDADLINIARGLKPADPDPGQRECPLQLCDGSGWRQIYHMHSHHPKAGGGEWIERVTITREAFDDLSRKVDWKAQMVYESRYRCACHPARPDDIEKKGKYA